MLINLVITTHCLLYLSRIFDRQHCRLHPAANIVGCILSNYRVSYNFLIGMLHQMWLDNRPLLYSQQAASKTDDKSVKSKDAAADKASVIQPTVKLSKVRYDLLNIVEHTNYSEWIIFFCPI